LTSAWTPADGAPLACTPAMQENRMAVRDAGERDLPAVAPRADLLDLVGDLVELALVWQQRSRERRQLGSFGDHMLKDLGVSRADVDREVSKPFWRR
jgi:uncharacterized protein YjiS (DUF1127 family)